VILFLFLGLIITITALAFTIIPDSLLTLFTFPIGLFSLLWPLLGLLPLLPKEKIGVLAIFEALAFFYLTITVLLRDPAPIEECDGD